MWTWLIASYLTLLLVLIGCSGFVAVFLDDDKRRRQAFKVLRLLLATCTGFLALTAFRLLQAGFLS